LATLPYWTCSYFTGKAGYPRRNICGIGRT